MCTFRRPAVLIFIFSTTGRWGRGAALFSHWLRYNFRFLVSAFAASLLLLFSFSFIFFVVFLLPLRLLLCFCFTGCATKRVRCCCCCCCWLSATALELIFIYVSGRWFRLYICGLQYSIHWNKNKELKNWQIDFFGMRKKYFIIFKIYSMW